MLIQLQLMCIAVLPKAHSVFSFTVNGTTVTLYGAQLMFVLPGPRTA